MALGEYHHNYGNSSSNYDDQSAPPALPFHLCFFLSILFMILGTSWYLSYESAVESLLDQMKTMLMLLLVVALLALHCLSGTGWFSFVLPFQDGDEYVHRTSSTSGSSSSSSSSPWGVALVLVLLIYMVSYKSSFQDRWFPLISR